MVTIFGSYSSVPLTLSGLHHQSESQWSELATPVATRLRNTMAAGGPLLNRRILPNHCIVGTTIFVLHAIRGIQATVLLYVHLLF